MKLNLEDLANQADRVIALIKTMREAFPTMGEDDMLRLCIMAGCADSMNNGFGKGYDKGLMDGRNDGRNK